MTNWTFGFSIPMALNTSSGTYTVSGNVIENATILGGGLEDDTAMSFSVLDAQNAGGTWNTTTQVWTFDYTDSAGSSALEIHLEGTFEAL